MKRQKTLGASAVLTLVLAVCMLLSFSAATYAWFSANRAVDTSRVVARTAEQGVTLRIAPEGEPLAAAGEEAELRPLFDSGLLRLMPVSTADLVHFVSAASTGADGAAAAFQSTDGEGLLFHSRLHLLAEVTGDTGAEQAALYLDLRQGSPVLADGADAAILEAGRLGIRTEAGSCILRLTPATRTGAAPTRVNGQLLEAGQVLDSAGGDLRAVADPAQDPAAFGVSPQGAVGEPLLRMTPGQEYAMDVYYYLEGCDPACTTEIAGEGFSLQLFFFCLLERGAV